MLTTDDAEHPHLDGATVLVMELATGSLADLLAEAGGRPLFDGARYLAQVAEGLAYMHRVGWVHGDLKPSNILIRADGGCCLADFGLAGFLEGTHAYVPPLVSWDYAPPERRTAVATQEGQQIRPSGDVWAFGVVAALVLGGRMPFVSETTWARAEAAAEYAAGRRGLSLGAEFPAGWRALVEDCLAAAPQTRPAAEELHERVGTAAGTVAQRPRTRRGRAIRSAIGVTAAASVGIAVWLGLGPTGSSGSSRAGASPPATASPSTGPSASSTGPSAPSCGTGSGTATTPEGLRSTPVLTGGPWSAGC